MGGYGSGSISTNGKKEVESCITLSLSYLLQQGLLEPGSVCPITWYNVLNHPLYTLRIIVGGTASELRLHLTDTLQTVEIISTPAHFGGERLWFACPGCGGRAYKLYLPPRASRFFCRKCHGLTYRSTRESHSADALLAAIGRQWGLSVREVKEVLRRYARSRKPKWRRKRDRRPDYRGRAARLREILRNGAFI